MKSVFTIFFSFFMGINLYADELKIHIIKPMYEIRWSSPSSLGFSTGLNSIRNDYAPIGHFAVELKCTNSNSFGVNHILTGMERVSKEESKRITLDKKLGLGSMIYPFRGQLVNYDQSLRELVLAKNEHRLKTITVPISSMSCDEGLEYINKWISHRSYTVYGGSMNALQGEGAGCADFAMSVFSVVTGTEAPSEWFAKVRIPSELMGDGHNKKVDFSNILTSFNWAKSTESGVNYKIADGNKVHTWLSKVSKSNDFLYTTHLFPNGVLYSSGSDFKKMAMDTAKNHYSTRYVRDFSYRYRDPQFDFKKLWLSIKKK
jgi:hypothetical protein